MNPNSTTQTDDTTSPLEVLKTDLDALIRDEIDGEITPEKQRQFFRLDKADKYNRGITYVAPEFNNGIVSWSGVSVGAHSEKDIESTGLYDYHIDITKSYGRKYTAVLGSRPFYNMTARPEDPTSESDRAAARVAETAASLLRQKWQIRIRNIEAFAKQWTGGNVYAHLSHAADERLWGTFNEPQYAPKEVEAEPAGYRCPNCGAKFPAPVMSQTPDGGEAPACPQCGAPIADHHFEDAETITVPEYQGDATYPHAGPKLTLCTGFTVTEPFDTTVDNWAHQPLLYEYESARGPLLSYFGDKLRKIVNDKGDIDKPGDLSAIHTMGDRARQSAASLSGTSMQSRRKTRWTFSQYWIPAAMFETMPEASRKFAQEKYPDGMKVSRVDGVTVDIENEAKEDVWHVFRPEPGEYAYNDPLCYAILPLQDITNDTYNLLIATIERGMPAHLMDPDVVDTEQMRSENRMLEVLWSKPGAGRSLGDAIATIPSARFPDGAMQLTSGVETIVQQHTGLLPAAWGGQSGNKTAEQARSDLNQALMQLSVPGEYATAAWVSIFTKAVNLWAKYGRKPMKVGDEQLDFDVLRSGKWFFEGDSGIPMSWAEIQQRIELIVGQNPEMAHALGLDVPINMPVMRDQLLPGMKQLRVPGEDERDRILERIRTMLDQQPIQGPNGLEPSIMPDQDLDDPQMDGDMVRQWLNGPQGRKAQQTNPAGFANVKLHLAALKQMGLQQQQPPQGQQPPDGGQQPSDAQGGDSPPPPPQADQQAPPQQ